MLANRSLQSRFCAAPLVAAALCSLAPAVAGADDSPLRGPTVAPSADRQHRGEVPMMADPAVGAAAGAPTIIERGFDGKLIRLERDPAIIALAKLTLSPDTRAKADAIVRERQALIDSLVQDNLKLLAESKSARDAGDQDAARRAYRELFAKAKPYFDRGSLIEELRPVLSTDEHTQLVGMVSAYRAASAKDRAEYPDAAQPRAGRTARAGSPVAEMFGAAASENLETLGLEVKASYDRVFLSGQRDFEETLQALALSPEQESTIRRLVTDQFQKSFGKVSPADRRRIMMKVYRELTPEQRKLALERFRENGGADSDSGSSVQRRSKRN
jgi:hypothetical protein